MVGSFQITGRRPGQGQPVGGSESLSSKFQIKGDKVVMGHWEVFRMCLGCVLDVFRMCLQYFLLGFEIQVSCCITWPEANWMLRCLQRGQSRELNAWGEISRWRSWSYDCKRQREKHNQPAFLKRRSTESYATPQVVGGWLSERPGLDKREAT